MSLAENGGIHNPKVGSSSLPRAIAHCPASAGLFAVWDWGFGESAFETHVNWFTTKTGGDGGKSPHLRHWRHGRISVSPVRYGGGTLPARARLLNMRCNALADST